MSEGPLNSAKAGVIVKVAEFDDRFVKRIVNINNETPIRQGKPFWHFKKSFAVVKQRKLRHTLERNTFLGRILPRGADWVHESLHMRPCGEHVNSATR